MNHALEGKVLTTADLAAAAEIPSPRQEASPGSEKPGIDVKASNAGNEEVQLAPLFLTNVAEDFRSRWDAVQIGFVDDPRQAVHKADELVAQVMKSLAETFSSERAKIESQSNDTDDTTTENLRVALRHYRSFFQRLLSL
jgi:hypothetical protein